MRRIFKIFAALAFLGLVAFWFLSAPARLDEDALAGLTGDAAAGAQVFYAAGCASCHAAPEAEGEDKLVLAGGMRFPSPFGTFIAPNISPDTAQGIGGWSALDLANAMLHGTSPEGAHYYPAFPYASYGRLTQSENGLQDVVDLHAFLQTLPPSAEPSASHEVGFPFNIRRGLGLWKLAFLSDDWVMPDTEDAALSRGRYLVESLGHCGECHTPRNAFGGPQNAAWLQGAPNPDGKGRTPPLHSLEWSAQDIAYYLETGFTPDFDSAGGHMAPVVQNMAQLPASDRAAIAAYIKWVAR